MKKLKFPAIFGLAAALVVLLAGAAFWLDLSNRSAAVSGTEHSGQHSEHSAAAATPPNGTSQQQTAIRNNSGPSGAPVIVDVNIQGFAFSPKVLTVTVGTTVRWTNKDTAPHTASSTSPAGIFNSGTLNNNQSFEFTFTQPGTYNYKCNFHGSMTATIVVLPVVEILVGSNFFSPNFVTVPVGTVVRWIFTEGSHNVVEDNGVFNSGAPGAVSEYEFTFTQLGTYNYVCTRHSSMQGTIVVVDYIPISSINPQQVEPNTNFTLKVGGPAFVQGSVVYFNNIPLSTTNFVTNTELQANIPANLIPTDMVASITVSNPKFAQFSNPLSLTVCNSLNVTNPNGNLIGCGTLNQALTYAGQSSQPVVIMLDIPGGVLTLSDKLIIPANTTIRSASCANPVVLNGNGVAGAGITLTSNVKLINLKIIGFNGVQLVVPDGGANRLECVKADRIATS